jgi:hypothetical protein
MVPKRNCKSVEELVVTKPTFTLDVPPDTSMEEQEDYEEQEDRDDRDDRESEEDQHSIVLFHIKTIGSLLKMNRLNFVGLVEALKRRSSKSNV